MSAVRGAEKGDERKLTNVCEPWCVENPVTIQWDKHNREKMLL